MCDVNNPQKLRLKCNLNKEITKNGQIVSTNNIKINLSTFSIQFIALMTRGETHVYIVQIDYKPNSAI